MTTDWTDWFKTWEGFPAAPASNPWNASLDQWWRSFQHDRHDRPLEVMERVVSQGRSFFDLCQQLANSGNQSAGTEDWQKTVDASLERMKELFGPNAASPASGFWQLPMDNWQRAVSAMSGIPGDYMATLSDGEAGNLQQAAQARFDQFLGTPGVGYTRELQEQYQTLMRLVLDYQKALEKYAAANADMARMSLDRLREKLHARVADAGEPVSSARELYDLWVACSEEVYADYVMKEEYAVVHGDLVNKLMAVKKQGGKIMDEFAGMFNMPTRSEMDTVHSRFQESRRSEANLRRELECLREELFGVEGHAPKEDRAAMKAAQKELHARLYRAEQTLGKLEKRFKAGATKRAATKPKKNKSKKSKKSKKAANKANKKDN